MVDLCHSLFIAMEMNQEHTDLRLGWTEDVQPGLRE